MKRTFYQIVIALAAPLEKRAKAVHCWAWRKLWFMDATPEEIARCRSILRAIIDEQNKHLEQYRRWRDGYEGGPAK